MTSDAQQYPDELKIKQLKRTTGTNDNSPNTDNPIQRNPINNSSRRHNLKLGRHCSPQHPPRGPQPIHIAPSPPFCKGFFFFFFTPTPPPPIHFPSQNHHHITSTEARNPEKDSTPSTTTNLPKHTQPPTITQLIEASTRSEHHIKTLI